jgi:hypothetical protein
MIKVKLSTICAGIAVVSYFALVSCWQPAKAEPVTERIQDEKDHSQDAVRLPSNSKGVAKGKGQNSVKSGNKSHEHLVPPPPPNEPSELLPLGSHNLPFEYAFMSKGLLSDRLEDLTKQMAEAKHDLEEKIVQEQANKEKAERFRELYKEGVVSRRELEEAEKEALNSERDIQKYKASISELESRSAMISQRLKPSAKQTEHKGVKLARPQSR